MKTYMAKPADIERKWFVVDAAGLPLGRVATTVADIVSDIAEHNVENCYMYTGDSGMQNDFLKNVIGKRKGESFSFSSCEEKDSPLDSVLYIKGIYTFATLEDEYLILDMYSCNNMQEVYDMVRKKTERTIIVNFALDKILENSFIKKIPVQADEYVKNKESQINNLQEFENSIGMSLEEYRESNYRDYFEYMIYFAIAEKENLVFTDADFEETIMDIVMSENMIKEEVLRLVDFEYIAFETIADEVENIIMQYVVVN